MVGFISPQLSAQAETYTVYYSLSHLSEPVHLFATNLVDSFVSVWALGYCIPPEEVWSRFICFCRADSFAFLALHPLETCTFILYVLTVDAYKSATSGVQYAWREEKGKTGGKR